MPLGFIKQDEGVPIYDKIGEDLRKALNAWQEAYEDGKNLDPIRYDCSIVQINKKITLNKNACSSKTGNK